MTWNLLVLPIVVPAITGAIAMTVSNHSKLQQKVSLAGSATLLVVAMMLMQQVWQEGIVVSYMGSWHAPFGITLVADTLSALMVLVTAIMGLVMTVYAQVNFDGNLDSPAFQPIMQILLLGICGSFLTGDLFNLYVMFEVMLLSSFVLLALPGTRASMEGTLKYVTLNLISSAFFLSALGILYAVCQSLNMADVATRLELLHHERPKLVLALAMMFLVSFSVKSGLFPLNFWLPASYHTPSAAVSAIFAALLTKVGVYTLFRTFLTIFPNDERPLLLLLALSTLTMLTGVLGAVSQFEVRRILSFHSISQIGYMVMGLGLVLTTDGEVQHLAIAAAIFYMVHHSVVKSNLFLIGGVIKATQGSYDLAQTGGLAKKAPLLASLFLISALSLAGIPPFSGFWSKLTILKAGLMAEQYLVVAVGIVVGLLTLISMIKIWNEAFWKEPESTPDSTRPLTRKDMHWLLTPIATLAALTVLIGIQPKFLYELGSRAADDLLIRERYIQAVRPQSEPHFTVGGPRVAFEADDRPSSQNSIDSNLPLEPLGSNDSGEVEP